MFIPLDEITYHFQENLADEVKIIVPKAWPEESIGSNADVWKHTSKAEKNYVFEASEFFKEFLHGYEGPFSMSFATEEALQDIHYHKNHLEIYYSEHCMEVQYQEAWNDAHKFKKLKNGGSIIMGPGVVHLMKLSGLTIIIGIPSVENDKQVTEFK